MLSFEVPVPRFCQKIMQSVAQEPCAGGPPVEGSCEPKFPNPENGERHTLQLFQPFGRYMHL